MTPDMEAYQTEIFDQLKEPVLKTDSRIKCENQVRKKVTPANFKLPIHFQRYFGFNKMKLNWREDVILKAAAVSVSPNLGSICVMRVVKDNY